MGIWESRKDWNLEENLSGLGPTRILDETGSFIGSGMELVKNRDNGLIVVYLGCKWEQRVKWS